MASLPENLTSLLGKTATGTATLIGSGISQYLSSKGSKNRKKALFSVLAGNLLDLFDKKSMLSNIQGLQDFEDSNVDNLEYINQRGQRRKLLRDEVLKRGGELIADPTEVNPEGHKIIGEKEILNNWRLERTTQILAQRQAQEITGPLSDELKLAIDSDAANYLTNLKSRGDSYDWSKTDKGLADVYTKSQREALKFYGKPTRQGAIGSWWGSKFGDDTEREAAIRANDAVISQINRWRDKDSKITSLDYETSVQLKSDHTFDQGQRREIHVAYGQGLIYLGADTNLGEYLESKQNQYSAMIKKGTPKAEAFNIVITNKLQSKEQNNYLRTREIQTNQLDVEIRKDIAGGKGTEEYDNLIQNFPDLAQQIETYQGLEPEVQKTLFNTLRQKYDKYIAVDLNNDQYAMEKAFDLPQTAERIYEINLQGIQTALAEYNNDKIDIDTLRTMYPRLEASDPKILYQTLAAQYRFDLTRGYISKDRMQYDMEGIMDNPFTPDVVEYHLPMGDPKRRSLIGDEEWVKYMALIQLRTEFEVAGRIDEYNEFIKMIDPTTGIAKPEEENWLSRMSRESQEWERIGRKRPW